LGARSLASSFSAGEIRSVCFPGDLAPLV